MTYFLDTRLAGSGGGCAAEVSVWRDAMSYTPDAFSEQVQGRDLLIATHGFNVNRNDGIAALSRWEQLLSLPTSTVYAGALWPGDSRWLPVVDYPIEGDEAIQAGRLLASFISKNLHGAVSVSFVSHSLGARMVLETVLKLAKGIRVRDVVLMAGAIDNTCLMDEYKEATGKIERLSVLASRSDWVLKLAFPPGNFLGGIVTAGHPWHREALGREGPAGYPASLRAGWQIPDEWDYGHLDYLPVAAPNPNPFPLPVDVPPPTVPEPSAGDKPAWSAAFVSTRYR